MQNSTQRAMVKNTVVEVIFQKHFYSGKLCIILYTIFQSSCQNKENIYNLHPINGGRKTPG